MATSSSSKTSCFQCEDSISDSFKHGWRLRSGDVARLCNRCGSVYEDGRFCETFHSNDDGWRDCESCGKLVHCGCVVSYNAYLLLDFGGVICMDCSKRNFITARNRCLSLESQAGTANLSIDFGKKIHVEPCNLPWVNNTELQQISRKPRSIITPLFEKMLTASDVDHKLARLVIPKKYAEAYFPVVTAPQGGPVEFQDTDGKEWVFKFRYWPCSSSRTYVLEGLRDYMSAMKGQVGDMVKFYRIEPEGTLVIGLKKVSVGPSS
ncbi:B3 domain-containing protein Os07g0563300 isoform X2 [Daucus carota subsp. sativus]|uniref:B3 domain-containing protein Os07g0563300 isoform X2 n=1 Tax=Daucus carota subsp. sativus TaxID=79200 RepID=UPI0007F01C42|nr:PREDICTED: B3 domain-containing protein Os07g0563300-like isoform X2 [Daucus carota subsp. sativus]